jgi:organic hydroperoxide reductase OsmC/OhrA
MKEFRYAVAVDDDGTLRAAGGTIEIGRRWTAEHLVLAGLARCVMASLAYHGRRAEISVTARAAARGTVSRRPADGRHAFSGIEVQLDVELDPEPDADVVGALLAKAERDCFIGASLREAPRYEWRVCGRPAAATQLGG